LPTPHAAGRRTSLLVALLINAFFGIMSAGTRSVGALVAMRLLGGVGVGGSVPVVFSFLAELLPSRSR
jgi:MFS family permease